MLDVLVPEVRLKGSCVMPLGGQREPAGVRSMWGCALKPSLASTPARSTMRANPAVLKGAPRSEVNTNADFGSCSRCSLRNARSSSPRIGCVLGEPLLTLRTARVA